MTVKYTQIISKFFPNAQNYATGPEYEDIVWITEPIPKEELDEKRLSIVKDIRIESVKLESISIRSLATKLIVGTDDLYMLRTYDEKLKEAELFLADGDQSKCNLLLQESSSTGVSVAQLAEAVVAQYKLCAQYLNPILGNIEAVRRNKIAEIQACVSSDDVDDVVDPVWPDLTVLQPI